MTNATLASQFKLLAELMELHGENEFKTKSYHFAARTLKNLDVDLSEMSIAELEQIQGIGKAIAQKIYTIFHEDKFDLLEKYLEITPSGVVEMLQIKGIGPKKIKLLWDELGIESIGELHYACQENRLTTIKGFGEKTQNNIIEQIEFIQQNATQFLWSNAEILATQIIDNIEKQFPNILIRAVGSFRTKEITLGNFEFLLATVDNEIQQQIIVAYKHYPVQFYFCAEQDFYFKLFELSASKSHVEYIKSKINISKKYHSEQEIYQEANLIFLEPELRTIENILDLAKQNKVQNIVSLQDIKGIVHTHTKYSDGINTIAQMADYCIKNGFEYLVISDHSKSAFYANGLSELEIIKQHEEIDKLNQQYSNFKILKSIESDILYNGNLDYDDAILKTFDVVIASVHTQLKMNEDTATQRLIKAIENPYTNILGHLSGRLLLSRKAYPLNYSKIIDACAANNVAIELNANPHRLDIDYSWIQTCQNKNVKIAINPDAHHLQGIHDIRYGIFAARKGALLKQNCINTYDVESFLNVLKK
jgi:DNA polymerase (family 10)